MLSIFSVGNLASISNKIQNDMYLPSLINFITLCTYFEKTFLAEAQLTLQICRETLFALSSQAAFELEHFKLAAGEKIETPN